MKLKSFIQALKLWAVWNLVTDIGLALALVAGGFPVVYIAVLDTGFEKALLMLGPISGLIGGLIIGSFQWLVLRNKIKKAGRWIWATALSWIIWVTAFSIAYWLLSGNTISIIWLGVSVIVGGVIGYAQFRVLKTELPHTGWWIAANIVGWITTVLLEGAIANTGLAIDVPIGFIVIGMITGVGIVFLFDKTSYRSFNAMMLAGLSLTIILGMSLYVSQVYGQSKFTLHGHDSQVYAVEFSPDGNILASGSYDNTVKLWDVSTGKEIRTLGKNEADYDSAVEYLSFSPDGKVLATLLEDDRIRLWDITSGKELDTLWSNGNSFHSLKFSPDGKLAVASSNDIFFWDIATGEKESWEGRSGISIDFSSDGRYIASTFQNNVTILDVNAKKEIGFFEADCCSTKSVAFTPDGKFIVSGGSLPSDAGPDKRALILWDINTGKRIRTFGDNSMFVKSIDISPDGTLLAVGLGLAIRLYDLETGEEVATLRGHSNSVNSVAFSPDGKLLASGSYDDTVRIWDLTKIK